MRSPKPRSRHRRAALWAALAALAALSACGGDGETAAPPPPPPAPPPIAAPTITTQPQAAAAPEGQAVTLSVVASSPGEAVTYQWALGGENISGATSASYTTPPMPFTTTPHVPAYTVRVSNSAGQVVSSAAVASRSALRSWQDTDTPLPASLQSEGNIALVRDAAGRTHVVSAQSTNGADMLYIQGFGRDSDQDAWSYSHSIAMVASGRIYNPRLAASADGSLMLVWLESLNAAINGVEGFVRAAVYTPVAGDPRAAGSWTLIDGYVQPADRGAFDAAVNSVTAGVYEIVYAQWNGRLDALARRYTMPAAGVMPSSAGFGAAQALEALAGNILNPLSLTHAGASLVAYRWAHEGTARLTINHRAAGAAWQSGAAVDAGFAESVREIFMAASDNGSAMLAVTNNAAEVFARRIDMVSGAWLDSAWARAGDCGYGSPALMADAAGNFDLVCTATGASSGTSIKHWRYTSATGWGSTGAVLASANGNIWADGIGVYDPKVGRDSAGNLLVAYTERALRGADPATSLRFVRYSALSAAWTVPADIDPFGVNTLSQQELRLLVDTSGRATAVWEQREFGANNRLRWARLR